MPFSSMQKDTIYIEKPNGAREGPYRTGVGKDSATIFRGDIDINEGETLIRILPQKEERYLITSAHYSPGVSSIPPHWSLKLRKETAIRDLPHVVSKHTTVNIQQASGIQVGDYNTLSIQNTIGELIQGIDGADDTPEAKVEAKSKLAEFLAHPLVGSLLGAAAPALISKLG